MRLIKVWWTKAEIKCSRSYKYRHKMLAWDPECSLHFLSNSFIFFPIDCLCINSFPLLHSVPASVSCLYSLCSILTLFRNHWIYESCQSYVFSWHWGEWLYFYPIPSCFWHRSFLSRSSDKAVFCSLSYILQIVNQDGKTKNYQWRRIFMMKIYPKW